MKGCVIGWGCVIGCGCVKVDLNLVGCCIDGIFEVGKVVFVVMGVC